MINTMCFKGVNYFFEFTNQHSKNKPMIYLGGAFQGIEGIRPITNALAKHGPVIAMDLPGFGNADLLDAGYPFDFYVELIENFLFEFSIDEVGIMGASYGSAIAFLTACDNSKVTSLTLAGTMKAMPHEHCDAIEETISLLTAGKMDLFSDKVARLLMNQHKSASINRFRPVNSLLRKALKRLSVLDQEKYVANSRRLMNVNLNLNAAPQCKTLVFTGEYDSFTTPKHCWEIACSMPNAQMALVDNADHMFHIESLAASVHLMATPHLAGELKEVEGARIVKHSNDLFEPISVS